MLQKQRLLSLFTAVFLAVSLGFSLNSCTDKKPNNNNGFPGVEREQNDFAPGSKDSVKKNKDRLRLDSLRKHKS
jgi:hypothetical protein